MFFQPDLYIDNLHMHYDSFHWSPESQPIAHVEHFITYIQAGWCVQSTVYEESKALSGGRVTHLYTFRMVRRNEEIKMTVHTNPHLEKILLQNPFMVLNVKHIGLSCLLTEKITTPELVPLPIAV